MVLAEQQVRVLLGSIVQEHKVGADGDDDDDDDDQEEEEEEEAIVLVLQGSDQSTGADTEDNDSCALECLTMIQCGALQRLHALALLMASIHGH
jgi:hypothetical protein